MVKGEMAKIDAFHNGCLRKIRWILWPNKISNVEINKLTGCNSAVLDIKHRRLRIHTDSMCRAARLRPQ